MNKVKPFKIFSSTKAILNSVPSGICLVDSKGKIMFTNEAFLSFSGLNNADIKKYSNLYNLPIFRKKNIVAIWTLAGKSEVFGVKEFIK